MANSFSRHADRRHPPGAARKTLCLAARHDQVNGLLKVKGSRCPGSRDFSNAVPGRGRRGDARLLQQRGDGHLNGKEQGLSDGRVVNSGCSMIGLEFRNNREPNQCLHDVIDFGKQFGKARGFEHENLPHADPLGTISRIDKGNIPFGWQRVFNRDAGR